MKKGSSRSRKQKPNCNQHKNKTQPHPSTTHTRHEKTFPVETCIYPQFENQINLCDYNTPPTQQQVIKGRQKTGKSFQTRLKIEKF
jgi:glutaredoxin 2